MTGPLLHTGLKRLSAKRRQAIIDWHAERMPDSDPLPAWPPGRGEATIDWLSALACYETVRREERRDKRAPIKKYPPHGAMRDGVVEERPASWALVALRTREPLGGSWQLAEFDGAHWSHPDHLADEEPWIWSEIDGVRLLMTEPYNCP